MNTTTDTTQEVHVFLPEEAVDTWRPTQAIVVGEGLYRLLPTPDYDPEDEVWEFLPGTIVRVVEKKLNGRFGVIDTCLVAVKA